MPVRLETITGTIEENMKVALQEEEIMNRCGPSDPYYRIGKRNVEYYLECAARLERGLASIPVRY
jgi:hypothetical protein